MKKILYIITQSEWGGAQKYVFDLAVNLEKSQDYEIHVAAGGSGALFDRLKGQNFAYTALKHLVRNINLYHDFLAYFEIKKLLHHIKPDIVHLNSSKAGFLGASAAKAVGIPKIIYTAHGFVFNEPLSFWKKWLYKKIELFSSKQIHKIICVSEYDRQTGINAGIAPDKLVTIHNGINRDELNFLSRDEARQNLLQFIKHTDSRIHGFTTHLLGCIANLYPTKGLDILIRAMAKVDAQLVIIGDGPEREKLKLQVTSYKLQDKVIFLGQINNASQYIKAFDLFVLPSRKEGLPYTLLEDAAAGVPIVATRVGGVPEIIEDGLNGYLAEPNNPDDLADKINQALSHPLTPNLASDFSLSTMLEKTRSVYEN